MVGGDCGLSSGHSITCRYCRKCASYCVERLWQSLFEKHMKSLFFNFIGVVEETQMVI